MNVAPGVVSFQCHIIFFCMFGREKMELVMVVS